MSFLRKRWVLLRHPHADIQFQGPVYLGPGFSLHIQGEGSFIVGPRVEFRRDFRCEVHYGGKVVIGADARFTYNVLIQCGTTIEIGERCIFGQATGIFDGNHRFRDLDVPMLEQGYDNRPIHVFDDAIVTSKCTVIADIGTRTYVGANSVVSRDLPAYCVAAGAPARVLDYFGPEGGEPEELRLEAAEP